MNLRWAATSMTTGRYSGVYLASTDVELLDRIDDLKTRGAGYVEMQVGDKDYPTLSLSFRGKLAVIECWIDAEHRALLGGDGSVPMDEEVELPYEDDDDVTTYTGEFVSSVDRALAVVQQFIRTGEIESLGDWFDL